MTLLEGYRRSIQSHSTQDHKRQVRQLVPLATSESSRHAFMLLLDEKVPKMSKINVQGRTKQFRATSDVKLHTLSLSKCIPSESHNESKARSNQENSHLLPSSDGPRPLFPEQLVHLIRSNGQSLRPTVLDVPLQLLQGSRLDLRRWSVVVTDQTLRRVAAHNHRIVKRQRLLADHQQCSTETEKLSLSSSHVSNQPTESLLLTGAEAITDAGLAAIALAVPRLKELAIAGAVQVTDAALRVLGEYCSHMERLDVASLSKVRGAGLAALVDHCGASLTHLGLADCPQLGDWVVRRCLYAAPRLVHLNLSHCPQVDDALLETLAVHCPLLRKLQLSGCLQVSDRGIVKMARHSPDLEYLSLDRPLGVRNGERITDVSCSALGEFCPNLRVILLAGNSALTDAGVQWLASRCAQLTRLDFTGVIGLTDATCTALGAGCSQLRVLRINGVKGISDVGLRVLAAGCTKLELLHVANLYLLSDGSNRNFGLEGLLSVASKCPKLQDLNLNGCFQLQERALVAIGTNCRALRRLSLQACSNITLVAIRTVLKGCQRLTRLDVSGVRQCDDRMVQTIAKFGTSITQLIVAGCDRIGDIGIRSLADTRADQLELLDLTGCRQISDAGITALCNAFQRPKLVHLVLADCPLLTQDSIARLAIACPQLLTLSVRGCRVSARVLQNLSSSWAFGELRLPPAGSATGSNFQVGIFPASRAGDRRYVAEFCTSWAAAACIQNLFRARVARQQASARRLVAMQHAVARRLQSVWRGRQARRQAIIQKMKVSHLEHCAIRIQRCYRVNRQAQRAQNKLWDVHDARVLLAAVLVQRRYRAMLAGRATRALVAGRRHEFRRKSEAAATVQHHFRRKAQRNELRLIQNQKLARSRRERAATIEIQRQYRGYKARRLTLGIREEQRWLVELQQRCAVRVQAQVRRVNAVHEVTRRRNAIVERNVAAVKLQTIFRARRGRLAAGLLALAKQHRCQDLAARRLQRHWRGHHDRLALAMVAEALQIRKQQWSQAAAVVQFAVRRYLVRLKARNIVRELLIMQRRDEEMKQWASTLVQCYWRRHQAYRRVRDEQKTRRTRWKQLVDTHNQHGAGYGAPFFYNQVNGEIRWRLPRDLLSLTVRPTCAQCEIPESASFECATCSEFFCDHCDVVVHGGGKRRQHEKRKLFDFYERRCEYGDGTFPSIWPSEILQDASRGYDFEKMIPRSNYQEMLEEIARFEPVSTGNWDDEYHEKAFDANGTSLWESFYDYVEGEHRYFHRITKRVVTHPPSQYTK